MIKHVSLEHGWYYHYRIHSEKADRLCNNSFSKLKRFLYKILDDCPNKKFLSGPRSSSLKFSISINMNEYNNHEVSKLCFQGLQNMKNYKTAHSKVQMFMLQFDKNTISTETPTWLHTEELKLFETLFMSKKPLSGHIDILRIEPDNKIWIWDYKPKAKMEKYASTQVFFYALMMSRRTGISLNKFRCGYFDEKVAYTFKPKLELLKKI